jgi:hypothetical protein
MPRSGLPTVLETMATANLTTRFGETICISVGDQTAVVIIIQATIDKRIRSQKMVMPGKRYALGNQIAAKHMIKSLLGV